MGIFDFSVGFGGVLVVLAVLFAWLLNSGSLTL